MTKLVEIGRIGTGRGCSSIRRKAGNSAAQLLIDNQRNLPADRVARNYREGIQALSEQHRDLLYLDHDLGDFSGVERRELMGFDRACWLEKNPQLLPDRIEIVAEKKWAQGAY